MKAPILKAALLLAVSALLFSCQKDVSGLSGNSLDSKAAVSKKVKEDVTVKGEFISHTRYIPDVANGGFEGLPVFAWYPGGGDGHMNQLGKFHIIYDQYGVPISMELQTEALGLNVPLTVHFAAKLAQLKTEYGINVPFTGDMMKDPGVVYYDEQGNALWGYNSFHYYVLKPGLNRVVGESVITGGSGKFAGATGRIGVDGLVYRDALTIESITTDYFDAEGQITY